jgi:late competence protein required for DNA uptake (superfamily II DNA/RNA helicase)
MKMFSEKKKYTCVMCSDIATKYKEKVVFCRDCIKIREYIRLNGIKMLLNYIEEKPTAPPLPPY